MNSHLRLLISIVNIIKLDNSEESDNDATSKTQGTDSRTELYSHTNMPVLGQNYYILVNDVIADKKRRY